MDNIVTSNWIQDCEAKNLISCVSFFVHKYDCYERIRLQTLQLLLKDSSKRLFLQKIRRTYPWIIMNADNMEDTNTILSVHELFSISAHATENSFIDMES